MSKLISVTKIGFFDGNNSRYTCDSEAVNVVDTNIADVETDGSGAIIMFQQPINLDGGKVTGFVVTQTQAQINTLMSSTASSVTASDGTAAAPSITFNSDTDTGLYYIGANNFGVATNGTKIIDIAASQVNFNNTTDSTTTTTGATIFGGGVGIAKALFVSTTTPASISNTGVLSVTNATDSTSSTTGSVKVTGGVGIAKALFVGTSTNTGTIIRRPAGTTVVANSGTTLTAAMMVSGYVEVTGTTGSLVLDSVANLTTALGTSPAGTTFDFTLNTKGSTPMTATNVVTLTAPASCIFLKQFNTTDVGTAFIPTVTATDGIHVGIFRVTFQTSTTIVVQRIG